MLRERMSFPESVETLAAASACRCRRVVTSPAPTAGSARSCFALMEAACSTSRAPSGRPRERRRARLLGPGFRKETFEKIRTGAARDAWDDLLGAIRGKFAPALLLKAGLVIERQGKEGHYDRFRNRVVFPILNEAGKVVGLRRAQPRRQRAQVPELARDALLLEEPRALRHELGARHRWCARSARC